ncbi:MAG TPA: hypothetical protein VD996_02650 [Chitinophagaceae bacterium]|nr:hypothetical protein [Chitinophagaceae bacterium]
METFKRIGEVVLWMGIITSGLMLLWLIVSVVVGMLIQPKDTMSTGYDEEHEHYKAKYFNSAKEVK